jgi:quercetin dioxygenase-like cupin family protein
LPRDALAASPSTPGITITRHLAFKGDDFMTLRARSEPGTVSGWHHGDYDVYRYVVSGLIGLQRNSGKEESIPLGPGDLFHVFPHTVHRAIKPSPQEANEVILFIVEGVAWFSIWRKQLRASNL